MLAILTVALAGALIIATHMAVNLEHRTATSALSRQRAFAASEHALWSSISDWDVTTSTLSPGLSRTQIIRVAGDSAMRTTVRLSDEMYWILAEAQVGDARRRTGMNVLVSTDSTGPHVRPVRRSWVEVH